MKSNILFFIITILLSSSLSFAQNFNSSDIKNIKVDNLSDEQITALIKNAEERGLTQEQLEAMALTRGMPASEIQKLRKRIEKLNIKTRETNTVDNVTREYDLKIKEEDIFNSFILNENIDTSQLSRMKEIYGFSLFNNKKLTFEPSLNIPTPKNYQVGPGDEIIINIWGASQQNYNLIISPEGNLQIQDVGPVYINGLTIEKASYKIKQRLSSIYSGLAGSNPNTFCQVSIGNLRSIKVNVTGDVYLPGTYTLPSLASVFNALYYAGGPGYNGSYRDIRIIRGNKEITSLDLYEFLSTGISENNIILQDQDVIFIPPFISRIEVTGKVKRVGIYELKDDETFDKLVKYFGGFATDAYIKNIRVIRNTTNEKEITDVLYNEWSTFKIKNGDKIEVDPIIERFTNRIEIRGAVYREGKYELQDGITVKKLIEKAEGLKDDAFMERAILYRLLPNNKTEIISLNLEKIMEGKDEDIQLKREDILTVFSIFDLEEQYTVGINGEIRYPGSYTYFKNIKLGDLIASAGGFKESASMAKIDVARRIKNTSSNQPGNEIAEIFTFSLVNNIEKRDTALQFILKPYDVVFVRKSPGYEEQKYVYIQGEVPFPGIFSLSKKDERISDLVSNAGGLTPEAYIEGARLKRRIEFSDARKKALEKLEKETEDTLDLAATFEEQQYIGIDLEKILNNPKSKFDLILQEGDVLEIPKQLQTVALSGAFLYPVTVRYENNATFRKYINSAGGYAQNALKRKAYVIYANGSVKSTHQFLGIKNYPKIEPGAEIIVPSKPEKDEITLQEKIALGSIIVSTTSTLATLILTIVTATQ